MEKSLKEMSNLAFNKDLGYFFQAMVSKLLNLNATGNILSEEYFKTFLLNDIAEVHDKVNLKNFWKSNDKLLVSFKTSVIEIKTKMEVLVRTKCIVEKSKSTESFIYYFIDLYREFQ